MSALDRPALVDRIVAATDFPWDEVRDTAAGMSDAELVAWAASFGVEAPT